MSFLTPLFLVGLAGLAIPVLIHLIQRERKNVVQFPSLMFLRRIPYESVQRRRIRHWALLLMRLAALALVVLAFARPFLRRANPAAAGGAGAREVVILVDQSYSMGYGDRWQRALGAARDAVNGLRASDRGSVVFFASGAEVALRSTADKGRLLAVLAGIEPSAAATRYAPALKLAGSILAESALPRREAVLVSDFQRSGWQGAEGLRLPDGATLTPVDLGAGNTSNASVTPVSLDRTVFSSQERVTVTAGVLNHGATPLGSVDVSLEMDGRTIQTKQVRVEANGSASATFDPLTLAAPNVRASVRIGQDALQRDNLFHFVVSPGRPVRALLAQRGGARDQNVYLARALAVGDAPRFDVVTKDAESISGDDLQNAGIAIVNDVAVTSAAADRLGRFAQRGGGLLVISGQRGTWPQEHAAVLPAMPADAIDRSRGQPARLVALEYGHSIFEPFRAPRSGDFSAARFYGYRAATMARDGTVLARFDDGAPALVEKRVGSGRVLVWLSSLDLVWNDLAVKPVFLPFVHQIARHLAAYREAAPWLTVGDVLDPAAVAVGAKPESDRAIVSPSGRRLPLDGEGPDVVELAEQGFYEVRGRAAGAAPAMIVASNVDLSESDLTPMPAADVVAAATGRAGGASAAAAELAPSDAAQESAQRVWWYLLFAGLLLFSAETFLSNRVRL
jgi:hypothetical protein